MKERIILMLENEGIPVGIVQRVDNPEAHERLVFSMVGLIRENAMGT